MRRPPARPRTCDAPRCPERVANGKLMCRAHWFGTPIQLRRAISDAWREKRIKDWSTNCLEARNYHAAKAPRAAAFIVIPTRKHEP